MKSFLMLMCCAVLPVPAESLAEKVSTYPSTTHLRVIVHDLTTPPTEPVVTVTNIPRAAYSNELAAATIAAPYLTVEQRALPAAQREAAFKAALRARRTGTATAKLDAVFDAVDSQDYLTLARLQGGGPEDPSYLRPAITRTVTVDQVTGPSWWDANVGGPVNLPLIRATRETLVVPTL